MGALLALLLAFATSLPVYADEASAAYKRGERAEQRDQYDEAFKAYGEAHGLKPKDTKYLTAYTRVRFYAALEHVKNGRLLRDNGKLDEAFAEFQRAAEIDHTSFIAQQEVRRTADMLKKQAQKEEPKVTPESPLSKMAEEAEGPVELAPLSTSLINLRLTEQSNLVYKIIGKLAGINILFDPDYQPKKINVELNDVTAREALDMVALESKTFWQPTSSNTILVAADTATKRKEIQSTVMTTLYMKNVSTQAELQEAVAVLKGILDVNRVQLLPNQNAIIVRGTKDQLVLAEKLVRDIDKPKPEVVIDIAVMQVSRDRIRNMGSTPPTSTAVALQPSQSSGGGGSSGGFTFNSIRNLNATNFLLTIPGDTFTALMSDSNTKLIQNPEIRALDNEKSTLKIGDRVPVATGSFGASGGGNISALVNTQFQYLDVGVNIDITPHVHSDREVTLKMTLEVSSVTGTQNFGGVSQPIIGQRRIEHEARLQDGEVNLVGGILEDTETQSLSGYPVLAKIPILNFFFGQTDKERQENEIVFAIIPHIIRSQEITDENLKLVDLGAGNSVVVRHKDPRKTAATNAPASPSASGQGVRNLAPEQHAPAAASSRNVPAPSNVPAGQRASSLPLQGSPSGQNGPTPPRAPGNPSPAPQSAPQSSQNPAQQNGRPAPAVSRAGGDPCPYGQHLVGEENGVMTCAFD
jgi:general secretion pathway protein D